MIPNNTPMTKSHTVMVTMMLTMVMYSDKLARCLLSHNASFIRSIPSTKMSAPTIITANFCVEEKKKGNALNLEYEKMRNGLTNVSNRPRSHNQENSSSDCQKKTCNTMSTSDAIESVENLNQLLSQVNHNTKAYNSVLT